MRKVGKDGIVNTDTFYGHKHTLTGRVSVK